MMSSNVAPAPVSTVSLLNRRTRKATSLSGLAGTTDVNTNGEMQRQRRTGVTAVGHMEAWSLATKLTGQNDLLNGNTLEDDLGQFSTPTDASLTLYSCTL